MKMVQVNFLRLIIVLQFIWFYIGCWCWWHFGLKLGYTVELAAPLMTSKNWYLRLQNKLWTMCCSALNSKGIPLFFLAYLSPTNLQYIEFSLIWGNGNALMWVQYTLSSCHALTFAGKNKFLPYSVCFHAGNLNKSLAICRMLYTYWACAVSKIQSLFYFRHGLVISYLVCLLLFMIVAIFVIFFSQCCDCGTGVFMWVQSHYNTCHCSDAVWPNVSLNIPPSQAIFACITAIWGAIYS